MGLIDCINSEQRTCTNLRRSPFLRKVRIRLEGRPESDPIFDHFLGVRYGQRRS